MKGDRRDVGFVSSVGMFFQFLWAMVLVVGLTYVAARMLKKIGMGKVSPSRYLNQIDYLPLGPKRGVALVQIVDRTVAVGVTDQSISVLLEVDAEAVRLRAPDSLGESSKVSASLSDFAQEVVKRWRQTR